MDLETEVELLLLASFWLVAVPIVAVGSLALITASVLHWHRQKVREKKDHLWRKLIRLARGNFELVNDAMHMSPRQSDGTVRLEDVVKFIVARRDTHNGRAERRRWRPVR